MDWIELNRIECALDSLLLTRFQSNSIHYNSTQQCEQVVDPQLISYSKVLRAFLCLMFQGDINSAGTMCDSIDLPASFFSPSSSAAPPAPPAAAAADADVVMLDAEGGEEKKEVAAAAAALAPLKLNWVGAMAVRVLRLVLEGSVKSCQSDYGASTQKLESVLLD